MSRTLLAALSRGHDDVLESPSERLSWPFLAEHDLRFHRALHSPRLREMLAETEKSGAAPALAARGRLRRLLGDDAGAARDLNAALDADPDLALARAWLAELDLSAPGAEEGLTRALSSRAAPSAAFLYRAVARLLNGRAAGALEDAAACRRLRPRSALAAMLEGEASSRLGRRSAAARSFAAAARLEPGCAAAWLLGARTAAGGLPAVLPPRAAALAEKALDADPTYALITLAWLGARARPGVVWRRHLGRLLGFACREPERAGRYCRQDDSHYAPYHFEEYAEARALLAVRPDAAWAHALAARGALRCPPDAGLAASGLSRARRAVKLAPGAGWIRSWAGLGLIKSRRPLQAERLLTDCVRRQPYYHFAYAWRGALRRGLGRTAEAILDLDRAIAMEERYPFARYERSLARRAKGDWVGAALDLDGAFRLDWRYSWVFTAGRETGAEEFQRGERELTAAIARHPSCVSLRAWRGDLRRARGDFGGALADLYEAAASDPAHPNSQAFLGRTLHEAGRSREALEPLARAAALAPTHWIFRGWLAEAEFRDGDRARAFALIAEIIEGTTQHWWALHMRARFRLEMNRPRRALADLARADSLEGRHAEGHQLAARARLALGDLSAAAAEADKALRISPNLGQALLLRAEIRRREGRAAEALADWKDVYARFPHLLNAEERGRVGALLGNP